MGDARAHPAIRQLRDAVVPLPVHAPVGAHLEEDGVAPGVLDAVLLEGRLNVALVIAIRRRVRRERWVMALPAEHCLGIQWLLLFGTAFCPRVPMAQRLVTCGLLPSFL